MNKCTRCGENNPAEIHTCTPQSDAQFLADKLDADEWHDAAAELRRLDALNAELIEALEFCSGTSYITDAHEIAEEALAKAKEQT